jgi:hypothetical protein
MSVYYAVQPVCVLTLAVAGSFSDTTSLPKVITVMNAIMYTLIMLSRLPETSGADAAYWTAQNTVNAAPSVCECTSNTQM